MTEEDAPGPAPPAGREPETDARAAHAARSRELEEACDFTGAAREALLAEDPRRAALLAPLGGDPSLTEAALAQVATALTADLARTTAGDLAARGFGRHAGALFERLGDHAAAAAAFSGGGEAALAARAFEQAGRPADAARALEAGLRVRPSDGALRLALGRLLARHGRTEGAVKALQKLDVASAERRLGLPLLRRGLQELGLEDAARSVGDEMARLGVADEAPPPASVRAADAPSTGRPGATVSPERGRLLFGRYETVREVATTPHARVFEAVDRITAERVAVKLFAGLGGDTGRDALLRFEREARALGRLRHPNVVPLREYLPEGPAIVLPWMAGGSLSERLRGEPMAPARAVEIALAVLSALGEAHRLGVLHRDVKPSNVLFDEVGTARLSDFGAAHLGDLATTVTAGAIGTLAYMSPEQRLGKPATLASDLYGAGVLLAELLTGEPGGPAALGRLDPPPSAFDAGLDARHDAAVARLLEEEPSRRPADAFEARRGLGSVPWPERAQARRPARSERPRPIEATPAGARLGPGREDGDPRDAGVRRHDALLDQEVLVLPLDEAELARARAFARAGHPTLPAVLRVDEEQRAIWVSSPRGRALADAPRALSPGQLARLREAVRSLHEAGGAHGHLDEAHLYFHEGEIELAYPRGAPVAVEVAVPLDLAALDRLG